MFKLSKSQFGIRFEHKERNRATRLYSCEQTDESNRAAASARGITSQLVCDLRTQQSWSVIKIAIPIVPTPCGSALQLKLLDSSLRWLVVAFVNKNFSDKIPIQISIYYINAPKVTPRVTNSSCTFLTSVLSVSSILTLTVNPILYKLQSSRLMTSSTVCTYCVRRPLQPSGEYVSNAGFVIPKDIRTKLPIFKDKRRIQWSNPFGPTF